MIHAIENALKKQNKLVAKNKYSSMLKVMQLCKQQGIIRSIVETKLIT